MIDGEHARLSEQVRDLRGKAVRRDERRVAVERGDEVHAVHAKREQRRERAERERGRCAREERDPPADLRSAREQHERQERRDGRLHERARDDRRGGGRVPAGEREAHRGHHQQHHDQVVVRAP